MKKEILKNIESLDFDKGDALFALMIKAAEYDNGDNHELIISLSGRNDKITSGFINAFNAEEKLTEIVIKALLSSDRGRKKIIGFMLAVAMKKIDLSEIDNETKNDVDSIDIDFLKKEFGLN